MNADEQIRAIRKSKGMTMEKARETLLSDPLTFGVMMVKANDADGMVAGACHSTADTLMPAGVESLSAQPAMAISPKALMLDWTTTLARAMMEF